MIITDKERRKLERMRKPVSQINRSYGPYQLGQYLIARLLGDGKAKSMEDLKEFVELCALETIEDLDKWFDSSTPKGKGKTKSKGKTAKQKTELDNIDETDCL